MKGEGKGHETVRVINTQLRFRKPFTLDESGVVYPAGLYSVDTEEQQVGDPPSGVWRRARTEMRRIAQGTAYFCVDPEALATALARDRASAATPAERAGHAAPRRAKSWRTS